MRIVLVYNYLPTHLGGIETVMDALAREYARRGHDVTVIGADVPKLNVRSVSSDYRLVGAPASNVLEERLGVPYPLVHPKLFGALRKAVASADLVHGHGFLCMPTVAAFGLARALNPRATCLLTEHVGHVHYESTALDGIQKTAIQTVGRTALRLAHGVVVLNARVEAELSALAPSTPIEWIPNGVDFERYRPPAAGERAALRAQLGWDDRPRVLFVGRLVAKKGAHLAVEAARLGGGAFEVVLAGAGDVADRTNRHATFLGPVAPERVAELYRAADVLLLPSHSEGFPVTAQEALATGLPVFLGEDSSYARYQQEAGSALRQVPRDAAVITRELTAFLSSPASRAVAGREALEHARRLFSWSTTTAAHEAFVARIRSDRVPSPARLSVD